MKETGVKRYWGFGASELDASPQPLSRGEGLNYPADNINDFVVCEARPPYKTSSREMWWILKERAREHRKEQTTAENLLWQELRGSKLGQKIRRQHPVDGFIVDFICFRKSLCIEVDGGYHLDPEQMEYDQQRTFILEQKGFRVMRFTNSEVETQLVASLNKIKFLLDSLPDTVANKRD
jgi:very-short-patch-repair endonuclease